MIDVHLGRQPPLAEIPAGANVDDAKHAYSYIFIVVAVFCSGSDMFIWSLCKARPSHTLQVDIPNYLGSSYLSIWLVQ